jgi:hypothetical protein
MTGTIRRQQLMGMWWGKEPWLRTKVKSQVVEKEISSQGAERSTTVLSMKPGEVK